MTSTTKEPPVFDMLTLDDLYDLHSRLCEQAAEIHATLMDGQVALISPLSDEWRLRSARCREVTETADAAYAEILRREDEALDRFPLTGVPMVCTACRAPAVWVSHGVWAHTDGRDGNTCPARPVKAMVAEGNASVPRA
jgi:hypothetical protein